MSLIPRCVSWMNDCFSGVVRHYMEHAVIVRILEIMSCEIPGCCGILLLFDG